jgi:MFS family permease
VAALPPPADETEPPAPRPGPRRETPHERRATRETRESLNPFRALLKHRNFRYFWIGQTVSLIGTWMHSIAQGWLALELSDSAFIVGVVSAAGSFPVLALALIAGVVADRYSKLRIVMIGQAALAIHATVLWAFVATGRITISWLIVMAVIMGVISAFEIPARQSLLVELVVREDLMDAIALNTSSFNLARIIGPSIAAAVIAAFGLAWCFAFNALSYAAVLVGLGLVRLAPWLPPKHRVSPLQTMREGLRYLVTTRDLAVLMKMVAVFSVLGVPYLTLMPVLARDALGLQAAGYGLLMTMTGIGALVGALFLAAVGSRIRRGRLFAVSALVFPVLLIAVALTPIATVAGGLLLLTGLSMILNTALANGIIQSIVPDALRGRVMAAYVMVFVGFSPIGSFIAGSIARVAGVQWAIGGGGVLMLLYSAWALSKNPQVRAL